jgi:hypothetical protein
MACPYFCPTRRLSPSEWSSRIRPPLGDAYEGECHARPAEIHQPARALLLEACNLGYASHQCRRFPQQAEAEAVRFCVRSDIAAEVKIDYVFEQAHLPGRQGTLVYGQNKSWSGVETGSLLERQAQAYLESYLAWKESGKPTAAAQKTTAKATAVRGG